MNFDKIKLLRWVVSFVILGLFYVRGGEAFIWAYEQFFGWPDYKVCENIKSFTPIASIMVAWAFLDITKPRS